MVQPISGFRNASPLSVNTARYCDPIRSKATAFDIPDGETPPSLPAFRLTVEANTSSSRQGADTAPAVTQPNFFRKLLRLYFPIFTDI